MDCRGERFDPASGMSLAEFFKNRRMRQRRWVWRCNAVAAVLVGVSVGLSLLVTLLFPGAERLILLGRLAAVVLMLVGIVVYVFSPVVWYYKNSS